MDRQPFVAALGALLLALVDSSSAHGRYDFEPLPEDAWRAAVDSSASVTHSLIPLERIKADDSNLHKKRCR